MSLIDKILGRPLASWEGAKQRLGVITGVPVLGLDAWASIGYGPEAALIILAPLGVAGLSYLPIIILAITVNIVTLYLSYRQTIAAYPGGGGAYIVAKDNLGPRAGLWAGVALLINYVLNVAVGISAGVGAVVSAVPSLQPFTLLLCLLILSALTIINLRGIHESGMTFLVPVLVFTGCILATIAIGFIQAWLTGGNPVPVTAPPAIPPANQTATAWLLMAAFANGCTAMT
jgi:amino acid transporter